MATVQTMLPKPDHKGRKSLTKFTILNDFRAPGGVFGIFARCERCPWTAGQLPGNLRSSLIPCYT
ncbi:hypothetical protein HYFRA_00002307 [Hymenoscyphus fraxineus]|uniref:Uncharacterized protein n=1 Tax=Hymenoscyphus fraxineus TaxID=746836 RepID=A0A9N9PYV9_9HELO|nr:hypothetical protein HYFRA_00002307 [Hymenoscyphus fraxineus]